MLRHSREGAAPGGREHSLSGTVPAALTELLLAVGAALGLDRAALLAAAGLDASQLADPDARVPFARHMKLWPLLAAQPGAEHVGLLLGSAARTDSLGAVGYALRHARTAGAADDLLLRYRRIVHDVIIPERRVERGRVVWRQVFPARIARLRHPAEASVAAALAFLRECTGVAWTPRAVRFQHPAPADTAPHAQLLGRDVRFGATETRAEFDAAVLHAPLRAPDPALYQRYERHAQALLARLPDDEATADRVRRVLINAMDAGAPGQAQIARALALSTRTLHRRLHDEGYTLQGLVDEVRCELARGYLTDPRTPASDVAFLLGFNDASAFHRAFRRWTGQTPVAFRRAAGDV